MVRCGFGESNGAGYEWDCAPTRLLRAPSAARVERLLDIDPVVNDHDAAGSGAA
jgi:hypothetical protein